MNLHMLHWSSRLDPTEDDDTSDTRFEIPAWIVCGRARYLSATDGSRNPETSVVGREESFGHW